MSDLFKSGTPPSASSSLIVDIDKLLADHIGASTVEKQQQFFEKLNHSTKFFEHLGYVVFVLDETNKKIIFSSDNFDFFFSIPNVWNKDERDANFFASFFLKNQDWESIALELRHKLAVLTQLHDNNLWACMVGLTFKPEYQLGKEQRLLVNQLLPRLAGDDGSILGLYIVEDITHLLKGDHFWVRFKRSNQIGYHNTFENKLSRKKDIISEREKEIVLLLAQGLDSNEIAEKLFISIHTVHKHRKNLLHEVGARDTTALVHLLLKTGVI